MTLDMKKYFENLISKEAVVSHFNVEVRAGKTDRIKGKVAAQIKAEYGDMFLEDADYVLFFTRSEGWTSKDIKKVFELTDRALGKDANKLSKSDFKQLPSAQSADDGMADDGAAEGDEQTSASASAEENSRSTLFVKVTIK